MPDQTSISSDGAAAPIGPAVVQAGGTTLPAASSRQGSEPPTTSPKVRVPMVLAASMLGAIACWAFILASSFGPDSTAPHMVDFHLFYITGSVALKGHLADAYAWSTLKPLEEAFGRGIFNAVPVAYPPPVALLLAALACLPIGLAYLVFVLSGFALLALALWRIDRIWFWPVTLALSPAIFMNVAIGQCGMLAAAFAGLSAALLIARRDGMAGVMAGLLATLKPQICTTLPILFTLRHRWRVVGAAIATVAALFGAAVLIFGGGIIDAFLSAMSDTSRALSDGRLLLHRVTSVYGALRSFGVDATVAMLVHLTVAVLVLGGAAATVFRDADPRTEAGLALMATAFVSPYFHDYDLTVMGVGLALVLPRMAQRGHSYHAIIALVALAMAETTGPAEALGTTSRLSIGAPFVLACMVSALLALNATSEIRSSTRTRRADGDTGSDANLGTMPALPERTA